MSKAKNEKKQLRNIISCLEFDIAEEPDNYWHYYFMGCMLEKTGTLSQAVKAWHKSLKIGRRDCHYFQSYLCLAKAYEKLNNIDNAIYFTQQALLIDNKDVGLKENLARLYQAL